MMVELAIIERPSRVTRIRWDRPFWLFADNAFAYASIQLMQPGARDDGWHTDGGCSLLHASVTIFGTRSVEVKVEGQPQVTLVQEPGSFYVGNLSALEHNVRHHEECNHTFDGAAATAKGDGKGLASAAAKGGAEDRAPAEAAKGNQGLHIAAMIRCDVCSGMQGAHDQLHALPCGVLPRREPHRGRALGRCPRGAP